MGCYIFLFDVVQVFRAAELQDFAVGFRYGDEVKLGLLSQVLLPDDLELGEVLAQVAHDALLGPPVCLGLRIVDTLERREQGQWVMFHSCT